MATFRIGGVPEHFNHAFRLAEAHGLYEKHGAGPVEFVVQACGTGAMLRDLEDGAIDVAVALTEGIVATIAKGGDVRVAGTYVRSPLCWAVSTAGPCSVGSLEGKRFGVSRLGSGSHLMATVLASRQGWARPPDFRVVGNFERLRRSVQRGETDAFLWETFTTKPYHDSGAVFRAGDISTPWPCFMFAVKARADPGRVHRVLAAVEEAAAMFHADPETMPGTVSDAYGLQLADAQAWYETVHVSADRSVSEQALSTAGAALVKSGAIPTAPPPRDCLFPGTRME